MKALKSILISDFTINNLAGYLTNLSKEISITTTIAPFNQVSQVLLNPSLECWQSNPDFAIIFCQPHRVFKSFDKLLSNQSFTIEDVFKEVDEFIEQIKFCASKLKFTLIASFTHAQTNVLNATTYTENKGISYILSQINNRLAQQLKQERGFFILNAQQWLCSAGQNAYQPKLWYLSKVPFHYSVFEAAANDCISTIKNIFGLTKKLIVVDLDDTLWGGIVGDVGYQNLILGGHNAIGEAYVDFQKALLAISNTGVQLAIVSKNEETTAIEAIEKNTEMILRKNNFVAYKINWKDKAQNILDIVNELNIGLDAVVFMDDNPAERARVKEALPQVFVPEMPADKLLYPSFINALNCFNNLTLSIEDKQRSHYYNTEKIREQNMSAFQSLDAWLQSIHIKIQLEKINATNSTRVAQLFNKTNQLNLSTRRLTQKQIVELSDSKKTEFYALSFSDKFGDAGLTGILSLEFKNQTAYIIDFILSCRVMGRKCEETMLAFAIQLAQQNKCTTVIAEYIATEKNIPCLNFFKTSGFTQHNNTFTWNCIHSYPLPTYIQLSYDV